MLNGKPCSLVNQAVTCIKYVSIRITSSSSRYINLKQLGLITPIVLSVTVIKTYNTLQLNYLLFQLLNLINVFRLIIIDVTTIISSKF